MCTFYGRRKNVATVVLNEMNSRFTSREKVDEEKQGKLETLFWEIYGKNFHRKCYVTFHIYASLLFIIDLLNFSDKRKRKSEKGGGGGGILKAKTQHEILALLYKKKFK